MTAWKKTRRSATNDAFVAYSWFVTTVALASLTLIVWSLAEEGVGGMSLHTFTLSTPAPGSAGGLLNAIVGSAIMCGLAMVLSVAVGVMSGTWLAEYAGDSAYARTVRFVNDILLSAPSVLVGLFVYIVLVQPVHGFSALAGAVALALIAVPIITRTTEDVLKLQPNSLRESVAALGTPRWTAIRAILWKSAASGILTGGLLALARISGETAPLLFTSLGNQFFSLNLTKPMASLPQVIFTFALSPWEDWQRLAWSGALIIAVVVLGTDILARLIATGRRGRQRTSLAELAPRVPAEGAGPEPAIPSSASASARASPFRRVEKLVASHVSFRYGDQTALKDVTVPFYEHTVTAIMGPSGCGKSTLLRALNRIHELYPDETIDGEIRLDGANILSRDVDVNVLRASVGMVFQQPAPFPLSIFDNVAFGVRQYERLSRRELAERVEQSLRKAALWEEVKDMLSNSGLSLSGGQQQRLCIARTIAMRPEVILLDEPCSALDPISTARIEETVYELKSTCTLAIVSHNLQQAARVSDFTAFMYLGEMVEFGPTAELFTRPQDERTRRYVTGRFG